jgi:cell shape-determining protein MreD
MGYLVAAVAVLSLAIIGKSMIGYSLVVPLVIAISFKVSAERSLFVAFLSGLIVSLVEGSALGRESFGLLLASGLIHLYGQRFSRRHWAFTLVFAALGSLIYSVVVGRYILLVRTILDALLVGLALPVVSWWKNRFFSEEIVLKI